MFLVKGLLFCTFSLFAQENVSISCGKAADLSQTKADCAKNTQDFMIGGPNCSGCKGLLPLSPLIFIDGMEVSLDFLKQLRPDNIKGFSVITDVKAIEMYGIRGTHGVLVITSKLSKRDLKKMIKKAKQQPIA